MSWRDSDNEDTTIYRVLMNHEEQYSIWPEYKVNPPGWTDVGKAGPRAECLDFISEVWSDMRPLSLRRKMQELTENSHPPLPPPDPNRSPGKSLVDRLAESHQPVEAVVRPDKSLRLFKEAIDRNYIHLRFTSTNGGSEIGFRLDRDACKFDGADFENGAGNIHVEGRLILDYVKARCIADIHLKTLQGKGRLARDEKDRAPNPERRLA